MFWLIDKKLFSIVSFTSPYFIGLVQQTVQIVDSYAALESQSNLVR